MTATAAKVKHEMRRVVEICYALQDDEGLSPDEFLELDEIMSKAMELAGSEKTIYEFIQEGK